MLFRRVLFRELTIEMSSLEWEGLQYVFCFVDALIKISTDFFSQYVNTLPGLSLCREGCVVSFIMPQATSNVYLIITAAALTSPYSQRPGTLLPISAGRQYRVGLSIRKCVGFEKYVMLLLLQAYTGCGGFKPLCKQVM